MYANLGGGGRGMGGGGLLIFPFVIGECIVDVIIQLIYSYT